MGLITLLQRHSYSGQILPSAQMENMAYGLMRIKALFLELVGTQQVPAFGEDAEFLEFPCRVQFQYRDIRDCQLLRSASPPEIIGFERYEQRFDRSH